MSSNAFLSPVEQGVPQSNAFLDASPPPAPSSASSEAFAFVQPATPLARGGPDLDGIAVGDPHALFRTGQWKRALLAVSVTAGALGALFFGIPVEQETVSLASSTSSSTPAVIGGSVSPLILKTPTHEALAPGTTRRTPAKRPSEAQATSTASGSSARNFSNAFQSAAR